jgi:hypothetical protein
MPKIKMTQEEQKQAFIESAKPLIKYLAENHHPHTHVIVTATGAELSEGIIHTGEITEFLVG